MDTRTDFIQPEFLNILFFQQKNLIIFPYVDLKHLHGLELFTVGYNLIKLESTALHNLKEILEFEVNNSYSQNPSLFLIYNLHQEDIIKIMELDGIRCILNTNENLKDTTKNPNYITYNKKTKQFLNYFTPDSELEFERFLISSSENVEMLQDEIQKIKILAGRLFSEINQTNNTENLQKLLGDYDSKFWEKILTFVSLYYDIKIPKMTQLLSKSNKGETDTAREYSDEYELILSQNKNIGKEFIQLLHEYRTEKVNPAHLELEELFNPRKLFNYLRNHHWKEGIPEAFLKEWIKMDISKFPLTDSDILDFELILNKLKLPNTIISELEKAGSNNSLNKKKDIQKITSKIPSVHDFEKFKAWLRNKLDDLEKIIDR